MNRRFVSCLLALLAFASNGLFDVRALGDVATLPADPPILDAAKQALNVGAYSAEFAKIGVEVQKLVQSARDKPTVSMVRDWLINEDPATATNPYQAAYTKALNDAFVAALSQPGTPVTAKINFGIVIHSLSGPKENLAPAVIQLLGDGNPAVVLWGERAAWAMMPLALQNAAFNAGPRDAILAAAIAGVVNHPDGLLAGPIADEAYRAINPKLWERIVPPAAALPALIDANLKLQQSRLDYYVKTGVPASPKADTYASWFLLSSDGWSAMNQTQQLQAVQQASNLVAMAGQRAAASRGASINSDLIDALVEEGKWISTLGTIVGDSNIQAAGSAVNKLSVAMPGSAVKDACDAVYPALQANPAFTSLQAPPAIAGSAPKSASSDASAQGSSPTSDAHP
jgi:hypothetical protein